MILIIVYTQIYQDIIPQYISLYMNQNATGNKFILSPFAEWLPYWLNKWLFGLQKARGRIQHYPPGVELTDKRNE